MPAPSLLRRDVEGHPAGLVLMLHGGKAEGRTEVEHTSMGRVGHYMFRRTPVWNAFAVDRSLGQLGVAVPA